MRVNYNQGEMMMTTKEILDGIKTLTEMEALWASGYADRYPGNGFRVPVVKVRMILQELLMLKSDLKKA